MILIEFIKNIFAPKKCFVCQEEGKNLCEKCLNKIGYHESICYYCKQKTLNFNTHWYCQNEYNILKQNIILVHYKNKYIKKLIKHSKFYNKYEILNDFGLYLGKTLIENIDCDKNELILIPTPMFFLKKIKRGYNQSEILAKSISKNYNILYSQKIIKKYKHTKPQSHLSKTQRITNLEGVFNINKKELNKYKNKTFVIVDDVISTGTTIGEIAKILHKHKIEKIIGLSIASG